MPNPTRTTIHTHPRPRTFTTSTDEHILSLALAVQVIPLFPFDRGKFALFDQRAPKTSQYQALRGSTQFRPETTVTFREFLDFRSELIFNIPRAPTIRLRDHPYKSIPPDPSNTGKTVTLGNATHPPGITSRDRQLNTFESSLAFLHFRNPRLKDLSQATDQFLWPHHQQEFATYGSQRPIRFKDNLFCENLPTFFASNLFRAEFTVCKLFATHYPHHFQPLSFDPGKHTMPKQIQVSAKSTDQIPQSKKSARVAGKLARKQAKEAVIYDKAIAAIEMAHALELTALKEAEAETKAKRRKAAADKAILDKALATIEASKEREVAAAQRKEDKEGPTASPSKHTDKRLARSRD